MADKKAQSALCIRSTKVIRSRMAMMGGNGNQYKVIMLTVPSDISKYMKKGMRFAPEINEEGVLFRAVVGGEAFDDVDLPDWIGEQAGGLSAPLEELPAYQPRPKQLPLPAAKINPKR